MGPSPKAATLTEPHELIRKRRQGGVLHRQGLLRGVQYWTKRPERGPEANKHIHWFIGRNEMSFVARRLSAFSTAIILLAATGSSAIGQKKYDLGATDTEIKIGNIMPY